MKQSILSLLCRRLASVAGIGAIAGCAPNAATPETAPQRLPQPPTAVDRSRNAFEPVGGVNALTQVKDQIQITILPIDLKTYLDFPELYLNYRLEDRKGLVGNISFCSVPLFRFGVTNLSDQTLRINGPEVGGADEVIVAVEVDAQPMVEATRKAAAMERINATLVPFARSSATPEATFTALSADAAALIEGIPILTGRVAVLPGRTQRFFACFEYGGAHTRDAVTAWFRNKSRLTVGLYDIPVKRDQAGVVLKKTSYQFAFAVTEWVDHYEYVLGSGASAGQWILTLKDSRKIRPAP